MRVPVKRGSKPLTPGLFGCFQVVVEVERTGSGTLGRDRDVCCCCEGPCSSAYEVCGSRSYRDALRSGFSSPPFCFIQFGSVPFPVEIVHSSRQRLATDPKSSTPPRMADRHGHSIVSGVEPNLWEFLAVCHQPNDAIRPTTSSDATVFEDSLSAAFGTPVRSESATVAPPPPLPSRRVTRSSPVGPPICRPPPASPSLSLPTVGAVVVDRISPEVFTPRRSLNELSSSRDHYELQRPTSTQLDPSEEVDSELIRLDNPRPGILRNSNDYVDPTKHLPQPLFAAARSGAAPLLLPTRTSSHGHTRSVVNSIPKHHRTEVTLVKESPCGSSSLHHHQSHLVRKASGHRHHHSRPTSPRPPIGFGSGRTETHLVTRPREDFSPVKLSPLAPVVTTQPHRTNSSNFPEKLDSHKGVLRAHELDATPSSPNCFERCAQTRSPRTKCDATPDQTSHICRECGRCRCSACTTPRPLPSCWACDNSCLISADSIVDCLSCLCCVRGCQYHLQSGKERTEPLPDSVTSCVESGRCARWSCLGAAAFLLPCIWCWWPLKGCQKVAEISFARCCDRGCRCERSWSQTGSGGQQPPMPPSKATLNSSTPGSQSRKQLLVAEDKASGCVVHPLKMIPAKDPT